MKNGGVGMITVFVRHVLDDEGVKLGDFDIDQLDFIVGATKFYGVHLEGSEHDNRVGKVVGCQFVVSEDKQYFEIIVE